MNYFQRFKELKPVDESGLELVPTPKITAVLTYEQILFYSIANPEDAAKYKKISRQMEKEGRKSTHLIKRISREISKDGEFASLQSRSQELYGLMWKSDADEDQREKYRTEHADVQDKLKERRELLCSEGLLKKLSEDSQETSGYQERMNELRAEIPLRVSANSPVDHLKVYGVLDYTRHEWHNTWDEPSVGPCIRTLKAKLMDELSDYTNDEIERIILFSGLYGKEHPYYAADDIQSERALDPGIVQVYTTGYASAHTTAQVVKKERWDLCSLIQRMMPKNVVKVELPAGPIVGDLLGRIRGKNDS